MISGIRSRVGSESGGGGVTAETLKFVGGCFECLVDIKSRDAAGAGASITVDDLIGECGRCGIFGCMPGERTQYPHRECGIHFNGHYVMTLGHQCVDLRFGRAPCLVGDATPLAIRFVEVFGELHGSIYVRRDQQSQAGFSGVEPAWRV